MPRAENRKRPPSMGNAGSGGVRNQAEGMGHNADRQSAQSKKQELLEKMKKVQQSKKTEAGTESTEA
jgi:hypothetical protein